MISIVIPNYNGRELLRQNLPGVLDAARVEGSAKVIVVDDASGDDSAALVRGEFPSVRVVELGENVGFGRACMAGARAARGDILVLLNSDVSVTPDFLGPLREDLADETVFAVSAVDLDASTPEAPAEVNHPHLQRGFLVPHKHRPSGPPPHETMYTRGGYSAYRKEMFLELGGFDPLYEPFYWEDIDICYRAWKRGWRSLVEPRSLVHHERTHSAIRTAYSRRLVRWIYRRNKFLLSWMNLTSKRMLYLRHLPWVLLHALLRWIILDFGWYLALDRALGRLGMVLERRREERLAQRLSDEEVFKRFRP